MGNTPAINRVFNNRELRRKLASGDLRVPSAIGSQQTHIYIKASGLGDVLAGEALLGFAAPRPDIKSPPN